MKNLTLDDVIRVLINIIEESTEEELIEAMGIDEYIKAAGRTRETVKETLYNLKNDITTGQK